MRITIATVGTRGDVQPYLALGRGLQAAGHNVTIATDRSFGPFLQQSGLGFAPVAADPRQALQEDIRKLTNPVKFSRWAKRQFGPLALRYTAELLAACQEADTDLLLANPLAFAAFHVAEKLGILCLPAYLQPVTPTRAWVTSTGAEFPAWLPGRGRLNYISGHLANQFFFRLMLPTINQCRQQVLGLQPLPWKLYATLDIDPEPILYGYSPSVVPVPPDWGPWLHVTGYWFGEPDPGYRPPPDLDAFLKAGPPPVYVGFGSTVDQEAQAVTRVVVQALQATGKRGILLGGWSNLGAEPLPPSILRIESAPHDWLFPQMAAVVHHGGAGTTAAGLRAGVPSVIVPYFADQPFWGRRIAAIGAGPAPIARKQLTAERLASALRVATEDGTMRRRAPEVGERPSRWACGSSPPGTRNRPSKLAWYNEAPTEVRASLGPRSSAPSRARRVAGKRACWSV
jgi:sterol 3beta-glucosyltransferase